MAKGEMRKVERIAFFQPQVCADADSVLAYKLADCGKGMIIKMKILVIEDDTAISELICMNLGAAGYDVFPVFDGLQAQEVLEKGECSDAALALVDVMLPGKDGFALMEDLQKAQIPVIYLTAKDDVISKVHGLKAGAEENPCLFMIKVISEEKKGDN